MRLIEKPGFVAIFAAWLLGLAAIYVSQLERWMFLSDIPSTEISEVRTAYLVAEFPLKASTIDAVRGGATPPAIPFQISDSSRGERDERLWSQVGPELQRTFPAVFSLARKASLEDLPFLIYFDVPTTELARFDSPTLAFEDIYSPWDLYVNGAWLSRGNRFAIFTAIALPSISSSQKIRFVFHLKNGFETELRGISNRLGMSIRSSRQILLSDIAVHFQLIVFSIIPILALVLLAYFGWQTGWRKSYRDLRIYVLFNVAMAMMICSDLPIVYVAILGNKHAYMTMLLSASAIFCSCALSISFYRISGRSFLDLWHVFTARKLPRPLQRFLDRPIVLIAAIMAAAAAIRYTQFVGVQTENRFFLAALSSDLSTILLASQAALFFVGYVSFETQAKTFPEEMKPKLKARRRQYFGYLAAMTSMLLVYARGMELKFLSNNYELVMLAGIAPAIYMHNIFIQMIRATEEYWDRMSSRDSGADVAVYLNPLYAISKTWITVLWGFDLAGFKKLGYIKAIDISLKIKLIGFIDTVKQDLRGLILRKDDLPFIYKRNGDHWFWLLRSESVAEGEALLATYYKAYLETYEVMIRKWRAELTTLIHDHIPDGFTYFNAEKNETYTKESLLEFASRVDVHPQMDVLDDVELDIEGDMNRPESHCDFRSDQFSFLSEPFKDATHNRVSISKKSAEALRKATGIGSYEQLNANTPNVGFLVIKSVDDDQSMDRAS